MSSASTVASASTAWTFPATWLWSPLDNEWADGYTMGLGIVRVDYDTLLRTEDKPHWYAELAAGRRLPD